MRNQVIDSDPALPARVAACVWCKGDLIPLRATTPERAALLLHGQRTYVCGTYTTCEAGA
jgi:hypothetical protein